MTSESKNLLYGVLIGFALAASIINKAEAKPPSMTQRVNAAPCIGTVFESEPAMFHAVEKFSQTQLAMWEAWFSISEGRGTWTNSHDPSTCSWEVKVGKWDHIEERLTRYTWFRCRVHPGKVDPTRFQQEYLILNEDHAVIRVWTGSLEAHCSVTYEGPK